VTVAAAAPAKRSDLGLRTITGLVLVAVATVCLVVGGTFFWTLVLAAALTMTAEWASMIAAPRWQTWLAIAGVLFAMLLQSPQAETPNIAGVVGLGLAALLALAITRAPRLALGMVYAGLPSLSLIYLQGQYDGIGLTLWTLAIVWATDIGAYFAGRRIGGPKLAPVLSPNKTWAGLIGGMICAILVGFALSRALHVPQRLAAFGGVLAIAAQAGDLYESAMKRRAGVKDSGRILPGHGGVMDRLDGVVPVACAVAALVALGMI
jgi:phosphatidate cytidylyltransferase